jgi:hypothetical protein
MRTGRKAENLGVVRRANWTSLRTPPPGIPQNNVVSYFPVARNTDGRLEVCAVGTDGDLWHIRQQPAVVPWTNWSSLGRGSTYGLGPPAIGVNADGRLEAFAFGLSQNSQRALWHISQQPAGGAWINWAALDAPLGHEFPVVGANADGRLEVFAAGNPDDSAWHIWQMFDGGVVWSSWTWLGLPTGQPSNFFFNAPCAVARNADGRLEVFLSDRFGALWHIWQVRAGGAWSSWRKFPLEFGTLSSPAVARNADGRLEVFVGAGVDGAVWHTWQQPAGGAWTNWRSLGPPTGPVPPYTHLPLPNVGVNNDGRLEVFTTGIDGAFWHNWQQPAGGGWVGWASLGTPPIPGVASFGRTSSVATNKDGRLEVFVMGSNNELWHAWQVRAGGAWM